MCVRINYHTKIENFCIIAIGILTFAERKMDFIQFILDHATDDTARLLLSRQKYPDIDMPLAVSTIESRRKLRTKVPEWYAIPSLRYPLRLSSEQCSSTITAEYKASLAARLIAEKTPGKGLIADLTGGLGVDSWAFSSVAEEVLYNEMQKPLAEASAWNFKELGINNIKVLSKRIASRKDADGKESFGVGEILDDFHPDLIFLDPARRSSEGRKVFLLEDCSPDVLSLQDELLEESPLLMLKLSPMADITMLRRKLSHVREVHVISSERECKEILIVQDRDFSGEPSIFALELGKESGKFMFMPSEEADSKPFMLHDLPDEGDILFEPGKALSKAGAFNLVSARSGLLKLAPSTHLYLSKSALQRELSSMGNKFIIKEILPLNKRTLKDVVSRFPKADVSARNIPLTSDELRRRLGIQSSGPYHIFGVKLSMDGGNYLLITEPFPSRTGGTTE